MAMVSNWTKVRVNGCGKSVRIHLVNIPVADEEAYQTRQIKVMLIDSIHISLFIIDTQIPNETRIIHVSYEE